MKLVKRNIEMMKSGLECFQEKCTRFLGSNARQNKDLEHVSYSIFYERALVLVAIFAFFGAGSVQARDNISIVGSSTVFPISAAVAERFGNKTSFPPPTVESTGTGGGIMLFCQGVGAEHPDITNASRRMNPSEFQLCKSNGVTDIVEVEIGFDGIVIANAKDAPAFNLTLKQVYQALAKDVQIGDRLVGNPYKKWSDIESSLPGARIEVFGPSPTSGTRDAFVKIAMEKGAGEFRLLAEIKKQSKPEFQRIAHTLRDDGPWVDSGENNNAIVQTLIQSPASVGIFGFSFLNQNTDKIKGSIINGVEPTFENIASGEYGISRALYVYIKKQHVGVVPGIQAFVAEFVNEQALGDEGYLINKGLIPLPAAKRATVRERALSLTVWDGS